MKHIDFTHPGGFPLRQDTLAFLQQKIDEVIDVFLDEKGGKSHGNHPGLNRIISGMKIMTLEVPEPTIQHGWMMINGELLYFAGDTVANVEAAGGIGVSEQVESVTFKNNTNPDVYFTKKAVAGGVSPMPYNYYLAHQPPPPVVSITHFETFSSSLAAGGNTNFIVQNNKIKEGQVVVAQLNTADQNWARLVIQAFVLEDGKAIVYINNTDQNANADISGTTKFNLKLMN